MVALLVVLTVVAFLVADAIVVSARARQTAPQGDFAGALVFAQDGGEPVDGSEKKPETTGEETGRDS